MFLFIILLLKNAEVITLDLLITFYFYLCECLSHFQISHQTEQMDIVWVISIDHSPNQVPLRPSDHVICYNKMTGAYIACITVIVTFSTYVLYMNMKNQLVLNTALPPPLFYL